MLSSCLLSTTPRGQRTGKRNPEVPAPVGDVHSGSMGVRPDANVSAPERITGMLVLAKICTILFL